MATNVNSHGSSSGASYVVFGQAGELCRRTSTCRASTARNGFKLSGAAADDFSGCSVASAGDVNGDGFADLIVGARAPIRTAPIPGASYVVFGKAAGFAANLDLSSLDGSNGFKLSGVAAGDRSGCSVASAGDVNGDGFDDLIVGAPGADPNGSYSGASYVVFGKAAGFAANLDLSSLDGSNGFKLSGAAADDGSGYSVASAGDVNGDGFDDLIVGALGADPNGTASGASYVVFGKAVGLRRQPRPVEPRRQQRLQAQRRGGGRPQRLLGRLGGRRQRRRLRRPDRRRPWRRPARRQFRRELCGVRQGGGLRRQPRPVEPRRQQRLQAQRRGGGRLQRPLGRLGGRRQRRRLRRPDRRRRRRRSARRRFRRELRGVRQGRRASPPNLDLSSLDGSNGFKLSGVAAGDYSGRSVASAGDVNGDGFADLIVGAPSADPNGTSSGASYVVFGRAPDTAVTRIGTAASQTLAGG